MTVRPALSVPGTVDEITPEWLNQALTASGAINSRLVTRVTSRPIGTGQVASTFLLDLDHRAQTEGTTTMVAKLASTDPVIRRAAHAHGAYEREIRFYQELYPRVSIPTPRPFHTDLDDETATFVLLMEDMAPAHQGDQIRGCSVAIARAAVASLVGLHAPLWGDASLRELTWLHEHKEHERRLKLDAMPPLWAGFQERYAAMLAPEVVLAGGLLVAHLEGFLYADTAPPTVVHGDYRLDNLLFSDLDQAVTTVDWQTCNDGPGLEDVAYFLGGGLSLTERREHEAAIVRDYHNGLLAAGVSDYEWDSCWLDYRRGAWWGC